MAEWRTQRIRLAPLAPTNETEENAMSNTLRAYARRAMLRSYSGTHWQRRSYGGFRIHHGLATGNRGFLIHRRRRCRIHHGLATGNRGFPYSDADHYQMSCKER